jgi:hypothetical protein
MEAAMTDTTAQQRHDGQTGGGEADAGSDTASQTKSAVGILPLLRERIARYRRVVRWFAQDAYGRFRRRLLLIIVFSVLAMGGLMGALGVIFFYVRALEDGAVFVYGGYEIVARDSALLLVAAASTGLVLFILSFIFRYAAILQALEIGRAYEGFCSRRAIALVGAHGGRPEADAWADHARLLIQSDPRFCARVARVTVNMILPVIAFAATFTVLIWLDPWLTILVIGLLAAALPFLYVVNVRGARNSMAMEKRAKAASDRKRELVALNTERGEPLDPESPEMSRPFRRGPIARHLDSYVGRLRANHNSELVTNTVMGISVVVILASKGSDILATGKGWGELAVYMAALRVNLTSVTQASKTLTSVNRFYPQVARYFRFLEQTEGLPADDPASRRVASRPTALHDDDDDE